MPQVAIIGAGTMGAGIAQIAAMNGWDVLLGDVDPAFVEKQLAAIRAQFDKLTEKGKLTAAQRDAAGARLPSRSDPLDITACELIIEAIVEDLDAKAAALGPLVGAAPPQAIFASNTSSLSISRLAEASAAYSAKVGHAQAVTLPGRFVGMHFFNPVPLMPLVEVIAGRQSQPAAVDRVAAIAREWGKTVVRAADAPGFIVNRVARGYYLEALRMLGEGIAGIDEIDATMKRLGGFRMGPFELMDLIGIDVNYSVSCSVWEQFGRPARLTPHELQARLVSEKHHGRKTRRGFYAYDDAPAGSATSGAAVAPPLPAVVVPRASFDLPPELYDSVRRFCDGATRVAGSITEQYILARVLGAIINEAHLALDDQIATAADIDTAMKLGTNYPKGPIEWATEIGLFTCQSLLRRLNELTPDRRFEPAKSLG